MKMQLIHTNLNLFRSFGGDCENENNTTRAFLIALTRSAWSPVLLRGFLDLVAEKIRAQKPDLWAECQTFLSTWPDEVEFGMQQGVAKSDFLTDEVKLGVLVDLTPAEGAGEATLPIERVAGGIVDAVLTLRIADEGALAMLIESKLYGAAGEQQLGKYMASVEAKLSKSKCCLVRVSWDDVYKLTDFLPEQADTDPVILDFKSFMDARPNLVSFRGFKTSDFRDPYLRDMRIRRLCEKLVSEPLGGDCAFQGLVQRKRGGSDYDLPLRNQQQVRGNLGIGCWDDEHVQAKLVVGSRTNWETCYVLDRSHGTPEVGATLAKLCSLPGLVLDMHVRLYFHRFDDQWLYTWSAGPNACQVATRWSEVVATARRFHRQEAKNDLLDDLRGLASKVAGSNLEAIERARQLPEDARPKCFVVFTFCRGRSSAELMAQSASQQLELFRQDLLGLARLLSALSR